MLFRSKNSYVTSGRNPTDLDLLDEGSEEEIESVTLEERASVLSMQGLASRSPQLDSSSCEEMYYPIRDPIRRSTARAAPPPCPHVQLDVVFSFLIPQELEKRLARIQQHDGVVVEVFPRAGRRQATQERERGGAGGGCG